jgi:hypothetical protein
LFFLGIPHALDDSGQLLFLLDDESRAFVAYNNEHEQGADSTLEEAEAESLSVQSLIICADGGKDQAETPKRDDDACHTLDGESLSKNHSRICADDEAEVENRGRPGVSITGQLEVVTKSKDCL